MLFGFDIIVTERESSLYRTYVEFFQPCARGSRRKKGAFAIAPMDMKHAVLTQTVEQLELINDALAALRHELLPNQPKKFAILAEGPLEDISRLRPEIERLTADIAAAA
jgi:hypothetical protein